MGLSLGIGVALASRLNKKNYNVYVVVGDGECNEGAVWEAAMAAPNINLESISLPKLSVPSKCFSVCFFQIFE